MTFERIDRAFRPAPSRVIKLECIGCGTPDDVAMLYPLWSPPVGIAVPEPLCPECSRIRDAGAITNALGE